MQHIVDMGDDDPAGSHLSADELLCTILRELGYGDAVDLYDRIGKWYA